MYLNRVTLANCLRTGSKRLSGNISWRKRLLKQMFTDYLSVFHKRLSGIGSL